MRVSYRSAELLGIGRNYLRKIPVDAEYRIQLDVLEETINAERNDGRQPFCLIGHAGTVNTGAVAPFDALADLAENYDLWFHIDGAYGAFAALTPEARPLLAGLERADSLTLDPHKWLNTPFESGCILTKQWRDLEETFSLVPPYLQGAMQQGTNTTNITMALS